MSRISSMSKSAQAAVIEDYLQRGKTRGKEYDCLNYDGKKVQLFREHDPIVFVGHMAEYDSFMKTLAVLKNFKEE